MQLDTPRPTEADSTSAVTTGPSSMGDDDGEYDDDDDDDDADDDADVEGDNPDEPEDVVIDSHPSVGQSLEDDDKGAERTRGEGSCDEVINNELTDESVLRANAVTYLSGVVINYALKKYKCSACEQSFCKENAVLERNDELFVHFKAYETKIALDFGHLKVPSESFRVVIDTCLTVFERQINIAICNLGIMKKIFDLCVAAVQEIFPGWFLQCTDHRNFCIKRLILIKLRYELKRRLSSLPKVSRGFKRNQGGAENIQKVVRRKLFH